MKAVLFWLGWFGKPCFLPLGGRQVCIQLFDVNFTAFIIFLWTCYPVYSVGGGSFEVVRNFDRSLLSMLGGKGQVFYRGRTFFEGSCLLFVGFHNLLKRSCLNCCPIQTRRKRAVKIIFHFWGHSEIQSICQSLLT